MGGICQEMRRWREVGVEWGRGGVERLEADFPLVGLEEGREFISGRTIPSSMMLLLLLLLQLFDMTCRSAAPPPPSPSPPQATPSAPARAASVTSSSRCLRQNNWTVHRTKQLTSNHFNMRAQCRRRLQRSGRSCDVRYVHDEHTGDGGGGRLQHGTSLMG